MPGRRHLQEPGYSKGYGDITSSFREHVLYYAISSAKRGVEVYSLIFCRPYRPCRDVEQIFVYYTH